VEDGYKFKQFFQDGSMLLVNDRGEERMINNGDSIRYDLLNKKTLFS